MESLLHSEHDLKIEKLAVGGDGIARLNFADSSVVVFVSEAAPEEIVRVKIVGVEKNHLTGEIVKILQPSPDRREAPCAYFSKCGGCNWQHINEEQQIAQKELILKDLFKKFLPDLNYSLLSTVKSEKNFNYRNRIQLKHLGIQLGYFRKRSHEIVDIDACLLADLKISESLKKIKTQLKPAPELKKFEFRINQKDNFEFYPIGQEGEDLSFSQVNNSVNQKLVETVTQIVAAQRPSFLTELYAGSGNFTFPLAQKLPEARLEAVEMNAQLTRNANEELKQKNLQKRLFFFTSDCESYVQRRALSQEFVLLDPPRAGCSPEVSKKLAAQPPQNLLYISCHPVSLVRDLKKWRELGFEFKVSHLQIFDMFPQTDHFETLIFLTKI